MTHKITIERGHLVRLQNLQYELFIILIVFKKYYLNFFLIFKNYYK